MVTTREEAALRLVNFVREHYGLWPLDKLRRGLRDDTSHCPIANSLGELGARVNGTVIRVADGAWIGVSDPVRRFIGDFDRGMMPWLEEQ